jgi:hypothetical protein
MNLGKFVFAQVMEHLPLHAFHRCVVRYSGEHKVKRFSCLDQYLCMAFAQLTYRESLRDIEACLRVQSSKLYHLGFRSPVARNTLANANATRDWRIYCDFARWFERNIGHRLGSVQKRVAHPTISWMAATLDGLVEQTQAVFEAKFMLPWSFSEEAAAEKHMAQLQHNMLVVGAKTSVLSIINGGGKWHEISISADPLYQTVLIAAEKAFWRAVETGEPPRLFDAEPPRPRIEAIRIVDMSGSNSWAEFAGVFRGTRAAYLEHERAKSELKALVPEDAKEALGHGIRARRSKAGAVSFDLMDMEVGHAAIQ